MMKAIHSINEGIPAPASWIERLNAVAPAVVNKVLASYTKSNSLKNLATEDSRRRTAASVLHAVDSARNCPGSMPSFFGLQGVRELSCALALIDTNIDNVDDIPKLAMKQCQTSILMSPALIIVVSFLLGAPTQVLTHCSSQELATALFAFGKQAVLLMDRFKATLTVGNFAEPTFELKRFNDDLEKLEISRVSKRIRLSHDGIDRISIPLLSSNAVFINGGGVPYADVVAPYAYYLCTRTEAHDEVVLDLWSELEKCGLLKHQDQLHPGRVALKGFSWIWGGHFDFDPDRGRLEPGNDKDKWCKAKDGRFAASCGTDSDIYPFCKLETPAVNEKVSYLEYDREKKIWTIDGVGKQLENPVNGVTITFVVPRSAKNIRLVGLIKLEEAVDEESLLIHPQPRKCEGNATFWERFYFSKDDVHEGRLIESRLSDSPRSSAGSTYGCKSRGVAISRDIPRSPGEIDNEPRALSPREQWICFQESFSSSEVKLQFLFS
jgi:hypothetical protein